MHVPLQVRAAVIVSARSPLTARFQARRLGSCLSFGSNLAVWTRSAEWPESAHLHPCRPCPTKVASPNRQRSLRLGGRNWSSCPEADLCLGTQDRSGRRSAVIRSNGERPQSARCVIDEASFRRVIDLLGDKVGSTAPHWLADGVHGHPILDHRDQTCRWQSLRPSRRAAPVGRARLADATRSPRLPEQAARAKRSDRACGPPSD